MPPRKYHPPGFLPSYEPRSFSPSLPYLLYWFNVRDRENVFLPWVRYTFSFSCALFVDSHPSASGGVSTSTPLHYVQAPPSSLHPVFISSPLVIFGLNQPYQSSLYRLNPNPPHPLHCYITQSVSSLPSRCGELRFRSSPVHHPLPARRAVPYRRRSPPGCRIFHPHHPRANFRIPAFQSYFLSLVLPSHLISLSSFCS